MEIIDTLKKYISTEKLIFSEIYNYLRFNPGKVEFKLEECYNGCWKDTTKPTYDFNLMLELKSFNEKMFPFNRYRIMRRTVLMNDWESLD